jgi:hypothetical protein
MVDGRISISVVTLRDQSPSRSTIQGFIVEQQRYIISSKDVAWKLLPTPPSLQHYVATCTDKTVLPRRQCDEIASILLNRLYSAVCLFKPVLGYLENYLTHDAKSRHSSGWYTDRFPLHPSCIASLYNNNSILRVDLQFLCAWKWQKMLDSTKACIDIRGLLINGKGRCPQLRKQTYPIKLSLNPPYPNVRLPLRRGERVGMAGAAREEMLKEYGSARDGYKLRASRNKRAICLWDWFN